MNKQIKELANKSFIVNTDGSIGHVNTFMIEQFAKSIIEECIAVVDAAEYPNAYGKITGSEAIRKHFD